MPDKGTTYRELIAKHLAKELSADEQARLQQWLDGNAENKQILAEAEALWKYSGKKLYLADTATEQEWQRLLKSIENNKTGASLQHRSISLYWKIAASVIMVVGLGYFISLNWPTQQQQTETEQYTTYQTTDSPDIFYLPDSSKIRLGTNSKLIFLSSFDPRTVQLEGEGFFEVQRDSLHMFSVNAGNTVTQVIGTSFSLRAYENEETVELVLLSGKVKFSDSNGKDVTMSPGEKVTYSKIDHSLTTEIIEPNQPAEKSPDDAVDDVPAEPAKEKRKTEKKEIVKEEKKPSPEELAMESERANPAEYLNHTFSWKKNLLNQTIIEGTVTNTAAYTSYTNIQLKIKLTTSNGQPLEKDVNILGLKNIEPGATMPFKVSLTEAVQDESAPVIEIIGARSVK